MVNDFFHLYRTELKNLCREYWFYKLHYMFSLCLCFLNSVLDSPLLADFLLIYHMQPDFISASVRILHENLFVSIFDKQKVGLQKFPK